METANVDNDLVSQTVKITLIVNAQEKPWDDRSINFDQVVKLAFEKPDPNPDTIYTVTYKRGPGPKPEGTMVKGDSVKVANKMVFNVTATTKS